ncbi:hypothetical protein ANO14919_134440 [Xylariales sp. No.14919]|nr:hypothetical protein ANO14919_134440 [Xylariales sp. No.14919]
MVAGHVTTADERDQSHPRITNHAASHVAVQPTKHAPSGREARKRNADAVSRNSDRAIPIIGGSRAEPPYLRKRPARKGRLDQSQPGAR